MYECDGFYQTGSPAMAVCLTLPTNRRVDEMIAHLFTTFYFSKRCCTMPFY